MRVGGAILRHHHLAEARLVRRDVLGQQLREQLQVVRAHAHARIDANEPWLLRRPLPEVEYETERIAVDEHRVGVDDLTGALLHLDLDRQVAHSSTTRTWPSFTMS